MSEFAKEIKKFNGIYKLPVSQAPTIDVGVPVVERLNCFAVAAGMVLALSACSDVDAVAPGGAAPAVGAEGKSYHLVTVVRPEDINEFTKLERGGYELCVANAKRLGFTVKPFPQIPADYVAERREYKSDGKQKLFKETVYLVDAGELRPESGCEYKLTSTGRTVLTANGKERSADVDAQGNVMLSEEVQSGDEVITSLDLYTTPKVVKGVALKCATDNGCIVDPAVVLITDGRRPVEAVRRLKQMGIGYTLLKEPVSLSVGKPIAKSEFTLGKSK